MLWKSHAESKNILEIYYVKPYKFIKKKIDFIEWRVV